MKIITHEIFKYWRRPVMLPSAQSTQKSAFHPLTWQYIDTIVVMFTVFNLIITLWFRVNPLSTGIRTIKNPIEKPMTETPPLHPAVSSTGACPTPAH